MELPKDILEAIKSSRTEEEAFDKVLQIKTVPASLAKAFREKYDPDRNLTAQQAFSKLYKEAKNVTE